MSKPIVVMLWGAPASGKTTIASGLKPRLEQEYGLPVCHLSPDALNQAIVGDRFLASIREALYRGAMAMLEAMLNSQHLVLLDGTFLSRDLRGRVRIDGDTFEVVDVRGSCGDGALTAAGLVRASPAGLEQLDGEPAIGQREGRGESRDATAEHEGAPPLRVHALTPTITDNASTSRRDLGTRARGARRSPPRRLKRRSRSP